MLLAPMENATSSEKHLAQSASNSLRHLRVEILLSDYYTSTSNIFEPEELRISENLLPNEFACQILLENNTKL